MARVYGGLQLYFLLSCTFLALHLREIDNITWTKQETNATNMFNMFKIFDLFSHTRNKRIFPSPTFVTPVIGNWYELQGYTENSPFLTLLRQAINGCIEGKNSEFGTEKI